MGKREATPYEYYTKVNIKRDQMVLKSTFESLFKAQEDVALFRDICKEERLTNNFQQTETHIDARQYYLYYHDMDCKTLKYGAEKFRQMIDDFCV